MRFSRSSAAAVIAAGVPLAMAQTFTDCNPTEKTCPADTGLNSATFSADFTKGSSANSSFTAAAYSTINYGSQGAEFSIAKEGQAPTVQTDFYFLFGRVDVKLRAAPGTGIVSSIVLESDDLDEIDWEFVGGDTSHVQTNFFGKGNTTAYDRVQYIGVSSPQDTFHTYSLDWNADRIQWIVDGNVVRTLAATDPLTVGGKNYPQTPMRLKLGNWCGGCSTSPPGTVEWAGGKTTFDNAPYIMYVADVEITNQNPATSYVYGDMSGTWQSIKINKDGSSGSGSGSSSSASGSASAPSSASSSSVSVAPLINTAVVASTTNSVSTTVSTSGTATAPPTLTTSASHSKTSSASATGATNTGAASVNTALTGASLISILLGAFML